MQQNDEKSLKNYKKWVKLCQKMGLSSARMGDWEFTAKLTKESIKAKKDEQIEGLTINPEAAMPPDSEMLFYSTDYYDQLKKSRKDPIPRT